MAIAIGRIGYLGLGIESSAGSAASPAVYLPYTDASIRSHHEPIEVIGSKTSRIIDTNSVVGKKWSEGDVKIDLDVVNSGWLWKLALGNETYNAGTPSEHIFYTSVSGCTPKTATLVYGRDTDVEQYTYCAADETTIEVSDGLAEMTCSVKGDFGTPATGTYTVTTTSGSFLSFKDLSVKFGSTLTTALAAGATALSDWSMTISNNLEVIYRTGSSTVSAIKYKGAQIKGSYTLFFENEIDKNAYYNLNKRAMIATFTGNTNESIRVRIPRFRLSESEISSGIDDFFVVKCEWVAEDWIDSGTGTRYVDVTINNDKAALYA